MSSQHAVTLRPGDALVIVDVQNDFLPGGSLPVPEGDLVIPALNKAIFLFREDSLPIVASRDWHPENHCSFQSQGGPWPVHCVAGSEGAGFPPTLDLPCSAVIVSKGTEPGHEAYSAFDQTGLAETLRKMGVKRLVTGGLATDYCVLHTVQDALKEGFQVVLLTDAIRAVEVSPGDGERAVAEMVRLGAQTATVEDLKRGAARLPRHG